MDSDYTPVLVRDPRFDIKDNIPLPVYSGAPATTWESYSTNGDPTINSLVFNIKPSVNVAVDRCLVLEAKMDFEITITNVAPNAVAFDYGKQDAFQSFPLNRAISTVNVRFNGASFSTNQDNILPPLLRMMDQETLQQWQSGTPVFLDNYKNYSDGTTSNNNPLGAYTNKSYNEFLTARGAHPMDTAWAVVHNIHGAGTDTSVISTNAADSWTITGTAVFREPLFVSPFIFYKHGDNDTGALLGLRSLDVNITMANHNRMFSTASTGDYTFTLKKCQEAKLYLQYLDLPKTFRMPSKIIVPRMNYEKHEKAGGGNIAPAAGYSLNNDNIQLQSMPEKILIYVQKRWSSLTVKDSDTFLPIDSITIRMGTKSGLLASAQPYQLYKLSRQNGVQLDWYSWSGNASKYVLPNGANGGKGENIVSVGSVLVIDPAKDLSLDDVITNGTSGNFDFKCEVKGTNTTADTFTPELVIVLCYSGYVRIENGMASGFLTPLNPGVVLETLKGSASFDQSVRPLVGGAGASAQISKQMKGNANVNKALKMNKLDRYCF